MKAVFRFYMPSRLLAHFSKSTEVWVCNYTLNAVFLFEESMCPCTNIKPSQKWLHCAGHAPDLDHTVPNAAQMRLSTAGLRDCAKVSCSRFLTAGLSHPYLHS